LFLFFCRERDRPVDASSKHPFLIEADSVRIAPIMDGEESSTSSAADSQTQPQESAAVEHGLESVKRKLCRLVASSLSVTVPGLDVEPMLGYLNQGLVIISVTMH